MQRIRVVGASGSGKTYLARQLAERLGLPHLELDSVQHLAGWRVAPLDQFQADVRAFVADSDDRGGWVIDGNYNDRAPELFDAADTIVWLDYPRWLVMTRVVRRSTTRLVSRRTLWNDNRESLRALCSLDPERNIVLWAWTQHAASRRRYIDAMQRSVDARWIRLRTPQRTRDWLQRVASAS